MLEMTIRCIAIAIVLVLVWFLYFRMKWLADIAGVRVAVRDTFIGFTIITVICTVIAYIYKFNMV